MKNCVFMESYSSALVHDGVIVSLDPSVSYSLHKNKIRYSILEDYYEEIELLSCEEDFFFEQLKWFDFFDSFLKENISLCKEYSIPLAKANYMRIKYFADTIIINSFILSRFFQNNPDLEELTYINESFKEDFNFSVFGFVNKNRKAFGDLLRLFCKKYNIRFINNTIDKAEPLLQKNHSNSFHGKDFAKSQIKKIYNIIRYKKLKKIFSSNTYLKGLNFLLMHAGSIDIDYPIKEIINHKGHAYVLEGNRVLLEDTFLRKPVEVPVLNEHLSKNIEVQCGKCAEILNNDKNVIPWINEKCHMDVSSVVLPYYEHFISRDCSYILHDAARMYDFYKQEDIRCVIARGNTDIYSQGPLVAAKYMKGAKCICTQHASFALDLMVLGVYETETYDCILVRDDMSQKFFVSPVGDRYKSDCDVFQSSHYLETIRKKYFRKKAGKGKRERVVYVGRKFLDKVRSFNNMTYPLIWYYEFQKEVVKYFAQETNIDFVYKHSTGEKWAEESILRYIKDKCYGNIDLSNKHFLKALESADRVIMDYPSGALFETAVSGKPVLCFCPDYFKILPQAKVVCGKSLRQFSSIQEAKDIIKEFLYGDPQDYIVNIPLSQKDIIDVFKEVLN